MSWSIVSGALSGGITGAIYGAEIANVYGAIIGFVVGAVVGGVMGWGAETIARSNADYPGVPIQNLILPGNTIGSIITDVVGTAKISGQFLIYGDEKVLPITTEGGGKGGGSQSVTTGYMYYMSWSQGICRGPVDTLYTIYGDNDEVLWEGELSCPESGGKETIDLGFRGSIDFYFGTDDQTADSTVAGLVGDATLTPPWRGLCYAVFKNFYIGGYNRAPAVKFIVRRVPEIAALPSDAVVGDYDYNFAHALYYVLNTLAGLPATWLDADSFAASAAALIAENLGGSICFDQHQETLSYINGILNHIGGIIRYGADGKFHFILIRDDYEIAELPEINEDVILEPPSFSRPAWIDTKNEVKVQYSLINRREAKVDGIKFNGTIVTVGVGKDYSTFQAANAAAEAAGGDWLYLLDPGTYDLSGPVLAFSNHNAYIRGMGAWPNQTIIPSGTLQIKNGKTIFLENLWIYYNYYYGYSGAVNFNTGGGKLIANKAVIGWPGEVAYAIESVPIYVQDNNAEMDITYCALYTGVRIGGGYADDFHIGVANARTIDRAKVSIVKSMYNSIYAGDWLNFVEGGAGTFINEYAEFDCTLNTLGGVRGPIFGDFRIEVVDEPINIKQSTADPPAVDPGNQALQGRVVSQTINMPYFTNNENAVWAGNQALRGMSYPFAAVSFSCNRRAFRYEPGDVCAFSWADYGISKMVLRILNIQEDGPESEVINITAQEDIYALTNTVTQYTPPARRDKPRPALTTPPLVFLDIMEAPYDLAPDESVKLAPLAARASDYDVGFDVYMSIDDGASYQYLARAANLQPYGQLAEPYPEERHFIDRVGFKVAMIRDAAQIESVSFGVALAGADNIAIVGDEIITFTDIAPVEGEDDVYLISGIFRARWGTKRAAHVAGAEFYFLGKSVFTVHGENIVEGVERQFKFVPFNVKNSGDIADAEELVFTPAGKAKTPYPPVNFVANGSSFAARYGE